MKSNRVLIIIFFLFICGNVFGKNLADIITSADESAFSLSVPVDVPVLAAGAGLLIYEQFVEPATGSQLPEDEVFSPDRYAVFPYNSGADLSSDILFAGSLLFPAVLVAGQEWGIIIETGAMLMESMILTHATKEIIKDMVLRYRPYTYYAAPLDDEYTNSFPSGHTALTFAVCSFSAFAYSRMFPESKYIIPFGIGAYTTATVTGLLRVLSGSHYITDVLAGALIGSAFGVGVPLLHTIKGKTGINVAVNQYADSRTAVTLSFEL